MKKQHFPRYLLTLTVIIALLSIVCFSVGAEEPTVLSISGVPTQAAAGDTAANGTATVPEGAKYSVAWNWYRYTTADNMGEYEPFEGVLEEGGCYFLELTVHVEEKWAGWDKADADGDVYVFIDINNGEDFAIGSVTPIEDPVYKGQGVCFYKDYDFTKKLDSVEITGIPEVADGNTASVASIAADPDARYTVTEARWSYYNTETGFYEDFNDGVFADGSIYQLYICVHATAGFGFSEESTLTVNGEESDAFYTSSNAMFIYMDFDLSKKITETHITGVTPPVSGEPATTDGIAVPQDAPYSVSATWYAVDAESGEPAEFTGTFENHGQYFLELTLIADQGYTFDDENIVYVDGEEQFASAENNMATLVLEYDLLDIISTVELTGTDQVQIGKPASSSGLSVPEGAPYTATAYWFESTLDESGADRFEGVFVEGSIYHYCINLTPAAGSKFSEDTVISYNGQILDASTSGIVSAEGIYIIAQTYVGDLQPISSIELYFQLEPGLTPADVTVSAPEDAVYSFTEISWTDVEAFEEAAIFEEGKEYLLTACILPADGYYIPEVETVTCLVNGQSDVGFVGGAYVYGYVFATLTCDEQVEETTEPVTEETTEPATEATTEAATEAPTEAPTEAATEKPSEVPKEEPTTAPTEPPTEPAPTFVATGTGHTIAADDDAAPTTPPTGDNTMLLLLVVLAVISGTAVVVLLTRKKPNK